MADDDGHDLIPAGGGFFGGVSLRIRLILRLLADRRVSPLPKLLPLVSLLYLLVPDMLPGPIDDGIVIALGFTIFPELCPPEIVQEHWEALTSIVEGEWHEVGEGQGEEPESHD